MKIKNKDKKMNEDMILERVAQKNGVSPEEVRSNIQAIIDDLWNGTDDTEEFKKLRLLIGHKPFVMEFLNYISGMMEKERASKPWWKRLIEW